MNKIIAIALCTSLVYAANVCADEPTLGNACSITCYEKTPTCYVSKDKSGCLVISNEKPKCDKGQCVCTLKGCDKKTDY